MLPSMRLSARVTICGQGHTVIPLPNFVTAWRVFSILDGAIIYPLDPFLC